ncbi:glycosyltransferase family 2 protein [Amorphus coralli]|uniref:glycosyltransferase family 2 protein n=1 Tax=Amorphus coralli TaxID=340680 RepID=UPI00037914A5|nr:glycosyltransferase family 2 protein [Amorphus coralli]
MTSRGERISVCLLTYNHESVIRSTLETVLDQTLEGCEVIVSDDCSTDGTFTIVEGMARLDPRIRAIRTPHNMGMAGNANFAVAQSARPYVALLHHDDLYRHDLLERWLDLIEAHDDMTFVFNAYGVHESAFVYREQLPSRVDGRQFLEQSLFPCWGCPVRGTAMIRRLDWVASGGMREQFGLIADVDLWMRLSMRGAVGYVDEPLISVRWARPDDYPDAYMGRTSSSFWKRLRLLYEIHAANRLAYLDLGSVGGRLAWWWFRLRLSAETLKWLGYAVVRRRPGLIEASGESTTDYDLAPLRLVRWLMRSLVGGRCAEAA